MGKRPGGELANRPLHFIWIADCSGSMQADGKIQALNQAIREALPHMRSVANENPRAKVLIRALRFSDRPEWHIPSPTPVEDFKWVDLKAGGKTSMGKALRMVAEQLRVPPMEARALPPVLVLISDGQPTDDFGGGMAAILAEPWGQQAVRVGIGIGVDADYDVLTRFIGNQSIKPLQADNPDTLVRYIRWASTTVLKAASSPSRPPAENSTTEPISIDIPFPPIVTPSDSSGPLVW